MRHQALSTLNSGSDAVKQVADLMLCMYVRYNTPEGPCRHGSMIL